jgi:hypothetical protein
MKTTINLSFLFSLLLILSCKLEEPITIPIDNSSISNVFDQSGFKNLDMQGEVADFEVLQTRTGTYLFIVKNSFRSVNALKFDEDFNFIKQEISTTPDVLSNPKIIENSLGEFIIISNSVLDDKSMSRIKKLNENLELVWDFPIDSEKSLSLVDIIETNAGSYLIAGKTSAKTSSFTSDFYIANLNEFGEVKSETSLDLGFSDEPYLLKNLNDKEILLLGASGVGTEEIFQAIVVDTSASLISNTEMAIKTSGIFSPYILKTEDDGFLFLTNNLIGNGLIKDVLLAKLGKDFKVQWSKELGGANLEEVVKILKSPTEGYFIILNTKSYGNGGKDIYVAKIDLEGEIQWSNTYGSTADEMVEDVFMEDDRIVVYCTKRNSSHSFQKDHHILVLDLDGNPI